MKVKSPKPIFKQLEEKLKLVPTPIPTPPN